MFWTPHAYASAWAGAAGRARRGARSRRPCGVAARRARRGSARGRGPPRRRRAARGAPSTDPSESRAPVGRDQRHRDRVENQRGREPAEATGPGRDQPGHHEGGQRDVVLVQDRDPLAEVRHRLRPRHGPRVREALGPPENAALDLGRGGCRHEPAARDEVEDGRRQDDRPGHGAPTERLTPASRAEHVQPDQKARLGARERREPEAGRAEHRPVRRDGPRARRDGQGRERHLHARQRAPDEPAQDERGQPGRPGRSGGEPRSSREPARDEARPHPAREAERLGRQAGPAGRPREGRPASRSTRGPSKPTRARRG